MGGDDMLADDYEDTPLNLRDPDSLVFPESRSSSVNLYASRMADLTTPSVMRERANAVLEVGGAGSTTGERSQSRGRVDLDLSLDTIQQDFDYGSNYRSSSRMGYDANGTAVWWIDM